MDFGELCGRFFCKNYKDWISIFNAVKATEPGYSAVSWLYGILITGFYFAVCAFEMFPLKVKERLKLMHDIFHMGDDDRFIFDWKWCAERGLGPKDFIVPSSCRIFKKEDV